MTSTTDMFHSALLRSGPRQMCARPSRSSYSGRDRASSTRANWSDPMRLDGFVDARVESTPLGATLAGRVREDDLEAAGDAERAGPRASRASPAVPVVPV